MTAYELPQDSSLRSFPVLAWLDKQQPALLARPLDSDSPVVFPLSDVFAVKRGCKTPALQAHKAKHESAPDLLFFSVLADQGKRALDLRAYSPHEADQWHALLAHLLQTELRRTIDADGLVQLPKTPQPARLRTPAPSSGAMPVPSPDFADGDADDDNMSDEELAKFLRNLMALRDPVAGRQLPGAALGVP